MALELFSTAPHIMTRRAKMIRDVRVSIAGYLARSAVKRKKARADARSITGRARIASGLDHAVTRNA